MDKKTLLHKIAQQELSRMKHLSDSAMRKEVSEWFVDDEGNTINTDSTEEVLSDYMEDYMRWQEEKSVEELQEIINQEK